MMPQQATSPTISPMVVGLDRAIEALEERARILNAQIPEALVSHRRGQTREDTSPQLVELDLFVVRLLQIKVLFEQDPRLLVIVDAHIGQHVNAMEKRQSAQNICLAVITTIAGAILGWLTSVLASPVTLWHLLVH